MKATPHVQAELDKYGRRDVAADRRRSIDGPQDVRVDLAVLISAFNRGMMISESVVYCTTIPVFGVRALYDTHNSNVSCGAHSIFRSSCIQLSRCTAHSYAKAS